MQFSGYEFHIRFLYFGLNQVQYAVIWNECLLLLKFVYLLNIVSFNEILCCNNIMIYLLFFIILVLKFFI
jgi:hypothetical protein